MLGSEQNNYVDINECQKAGRPQVDLIRRLNDAFRRGQAVGQIMVTRGIYDLGSEVGQELRLRIAAYDAFSEDNDPYGEHDFGSLNVMGHRVFWKIDYYDKSLQAGSSNPADPDVTVRVMTIMLASEY